jgi:hypothetical protein
MPSCICAAASALGILDHKTPATVSVIRQAQVNIEGNKVSMILLLPDFFALPGGVGTGLCFLLMEFFSL